jgi:hypothetical protein
MELKDLIRESFTGLDTDWGIEPKLKSKRVITFFILEDVSHDLKLEVQKRCEVICKKMGRKSFLINHPLIKTGGSGDWIIQGGLWQINIL